MKPLKTIVVCAFALAVARGQGVSINAAADQQWQALEQLLKTAVATPIAAGKKTPGELGKARAEKAQRAQQASQAAKVFHTGFPSHANANAAKKMEVVMAIHGAMDGNNGRQIAASRLANDFLTAKTNAAQDRFEVAVLLERFEVSRKKNSELYADDAAELEKIAEKLAGEYGNQPAFFDFYASIARHADMATGRRIANRINLGPSSPSARAEARAILDRLALVGQPLNMMVVSVDGQPFELAQHRAGPTLIYVWDGRTGNFDGLAELKKSPALSGVTLLYYTPAATQGGLLAAKAKAPLPGLFCLDLLNAPGQLGAALQVRHTPLVGVLDRRGIFRGYGPPSEIPALLALAKN